jgi:DHA1 family tetracycline resistance protein-like MFS transporter
VAKPSSHLGIIFLTVLIDLIGFGIVIPVLPRYAEHFHASPGQTGWLVGVFSLAMLIFSPVWGRVSDRIGRKPVLILSITGTALGFFLMGAAQTLTLLFIARIIDGISGANIGTAQAYIADVTTREERSRAMGLIGAAFGLGFVLGPALGGILSKHYGFAAPFYVAGALAVCNVLLVITILPESLPPERRGTGARQPLSDVLQHAHREIYFKVIAIYTCMIAGFSIMTTLFALFIWHRFGLDEAHAGYVLALVGFIGAVIQGGLIGRLVKRFGEVRLTHFGAVFLAVGLFALPLSVGIGTLLLATAAISIGNSLLMPSLTGLASRSIDAQWQGRALGIMQSFGSLARWIGPVAAGWLLTLDLDKSATFYARTPLWVGAGLLVLTFLITLTLPHQAEAPEPLPAATAPTP